MNGHAHNSFSASSSLINNNTNLQNKIFQITKIKNRKKWTDEDDSLLVHLVSKYKEKHWKEISKHFNNKNSLQCFSRYKRVRPGIVKGAWMKEEDEQIVQLVNEYGQSWSKIAKIVNSRNGKQIRDRYINALDPDIKKGKFSDDEDRLLIKLYIANGPRWSLISKGFANRTADMVKNRFHSSIKKIFFTQEAITRKTKLMQRLKEKKNSVINETITQNIIDSNTITTNICFSLGKNKKKQQEIHNDSLSPLVDQVVVDCLASASAQSSSSVINKNNNNCTSSFDDIDDIDFFSIMTGNNNSFSINNEFFYLN